jgi:DNA-binding NarL/FixJ family response regulator
MQPSIQHSFIEVHMKILVIENAPAICKRLLALLDDSGRYEGIGCVTCTTSALELIASCQPDALLLDLRLADGSGLKLLETLRAAANTIPTVLLADCVGWQYQIRAQALGAPLLNKTESFEAILPTLDALLAGAATMESRS